MNRQIKQLEAVLFVSGAPVGKKKLVDLLGCSDDDLNAMINELNGRERAVVIVDDGARIVLAVDPSVREFAESVRKSEEEAPLSVSARETLSIIAYAGPISKAHLDFLRGVNTQYILRRLLMRGLIHEERKAGERLLAVTVDFLQHLGLKRKEEMPEYEAISRSIQESIGAASAEESE